MDGPAYLLLDRHGNLIGLSQTREEAIEMAYEVDPAGNIYLDAPTEQDYTETEPLRMVANARRKLPVAKRITQAPQDSLRAVMEAIGTKRIDFKKAMRMSLEEAHKKLMPLFPTTTKKGEQRPRAGQGYGSPKTMAKLFLGQNYKTSKSTPDHITETLFRDTGFREASVMALSLLPTTQSFRNKDVVRVMDAARETYGVPDVYDIRINTCVRATPECASSCLVFSGQNLIGDYNTVKKYALLSSLVVEPEAFIRMLVESIRRHRCSTACDGVAPLVRLNVYSDLPWELMVPEMFEMFPDVQFYDYTKVPNRKPPANYDLTFSYAGTEHNVAAMDFEIREHGRRVAVVFCSSSVRVLYNAQWFDEHGEPQERTTTKGTATSTIEKHGGEMSIIGRFEIPDKPAYLHRVRGEKTRKIRVVPETFLGLPVVDGDISDMRPYDPAPVIVGLSWREPVNQSVTLEQASVFVVLVDLVPKDDGGYHAIVSKTARFDNDDYSQYAPEGY